MSAPGTVKVVTFFVVDLAGEPYDPPKVVARYGLVDGTETVKTFGIDPEIENPAMGTFVVNVPCPSAGEWGCRLEALKVTNETLGAFEQYWTISPSRLMP